MSSLNLNVSGLMAWLVMGCLLVGCDEELEQTGFSGARALGHAADVVELGPRPPGSAALEQSRRMIEQHMEAAGWSGRRQRFTARTPVGRITMENLRFRFAGSERDDVVWARPAKVLLGCHYDTKLYEDFEFVGANDGGSGCGLLMEMATVLAAKFPQLASEVELVFFDGEEAIGEDIVYSTTAGFDRQDAYDGLYGSHYYARQLRMQPRSQWPQAVVIVDMIGDRDLNIEIPTNCDRRLTELALAAAAEVGAGKYVERAGGAVTDDHVPFHLLGIPVVNFIDFDFEPWHTEGDVLSTISGESLGVSGAVVLRFLQNFLLHAP